MKEKTREDLLRLLNHVFNGEASSMYKDKDLLDEFIYEIEALEVEPEPYFKDSDLVSYLPFGRTYKRVNMYADIPNQLIKLEIKHVTEWNKLECSLMDLPTPPENAKGFHLKHEDGSMSSIEKDFAVTLRKKVIAWSFWYD